MNTILVILKISKNFSEFINYSNYFFEDDFRRILEKHSNLNLTQFFDEWIYGRGFPKLKVNNNFGGKISLKNSKISTNNLRKS